jgi:D-alanyl-D-alanine carboxypeptidase
MKNETFRKIASTTYYKLPTTNKYNKDDRFFTTTNSLLLKNSSLKEENFYYKYALGIKTGFTTPAGNCLISAANVNNLELITVILGANTSEQRYLDTISLFKYGFNNYIQKEIANSGDLIQTVNIKNATRKTKKLNAIISDDVYVLCKKEDSDSTFLPSITLNKDLKAPIKTGDIIGTVKYNVEGIDYTQYLLSNNDVEKSYWCVLPIILIFIIIIWYIIKKIYLKPKKTKKKGIS